MTPHNAPFQDYDFLDSQHITLADIPPFQAIQGSAKHPIILSVPHGGTYYPMEIIEKDDPALPAFRSLEDSGTAYLAPLLSTQCYFSINANLSRALLDLNRAEDALDPLLFDEALPKITASYPFYRHIRSGYGVIPRLSANRKQLYPAPLPLSLAQDMIAQFHRPYHQMLERKLSDITKRNGVALLVDIHSMPAQSAGKKMPDFVFGDNFGASLPDNLHHHIDEIMAKTSYDFGWNHPYAGGYITQHYGNHFGPVYALQIEINRNLYCKAQHKISHQALQNIAAILRLLLDGLSKAMVKDNRAEAAE